MENDSGIVLTHWPLGQHNGEYFVHTNFALIPLIESAGKKKSAFDLTKQIAQKLYGKCFKTVTSTTVNTAIFHIYS